MPTSYQVGLVILAIIDRVVPWESPSHAMIRARRRNIPVHRPHSDRDRAADRASRAFTARQPVNRYV